MEIEKRIIPGTIEIEARADGEESRTVTGYGVVFGKRSKLLGYGSWVFYETVDRSAFEGVDFSEVVATFNHNFDYPMGRTDSNTLTLTIDDTGVKYRFEAPKTTAGNDLLENIRNGNVKGSSFMFTVDEDRWDYKKDDPDERTIMKVGSLIELGPVTMPAYPDTTSSARFEAAKRSYEEQKRAEVHPNKYKYLKLKRSRK